jgi:hypothetical protein
MRTLVIFMVALVVAPFAINHVDYLLKHNGYAAIAYAGDGYREEVRRSRLSEIEPDVDRNSPIEPNTQLTPGATLPVTVSDLCVRGYTRTVRSVPTSRRRAVFAEYGLINFRGGYELDHLIALELGGSNSIQNLWPETKHATWNAYVKDHLENRLHTMVCSGQLPLAQAQHEIATDWIAAYKKYIGPEPQ